MKWLLSLIALGLVAYSGSMLMSNDIKESNEKLNHNLVGIWQDGEFDPPVWGYTLDLKADGTFTYSYFDDQVNEDATGQWRTEGDKLFLDYGSNPVKELSKELKFAPGKIYRYRTPEGEFDENVYLVKQGNSGLVAE